MCEFCHQHGEGKKWYLNAANYAEELYNDAAKAAMKSVLGPLAAVPPQPPAMAASPAQQFVFRHAAGLVRWVAKKRQKDVHWGQVVPLEDALQVIDMMDWVVRLPCVCRAQFTGDTRARYCFGIGVAPLEEPSRRLFQEVVHPSLSLESLTREQAREAIQELDQRGTVHSVWTFKSPYIGGLCNCDQDCGAYRATVQWKFQCMFRAEYVAQVDKDKCVGCRRCMSHCLFGAMSYSLGQEKCGVNPVACYGCGACRSACKQEAITLLPRETAPLAAGLWGL